MKIFVTVVEALKKKERRVEDGMNSIYHKN
jgi:hypothetical protein